MHPAPTPDHLRHRLETYVSNYPGTTGEKNIWRSPLLVTARADQRFDILPRIAASNHLLPTDLLSSARSVVVFFIPFIKDLALENHKGQRPCRNWGLTYESTNRLINSLCQDFSGYLQGMGFRAALVPATHNFDHTTLVSRWSHKHLGYLADLGRFGVNAQFITPSGCAGRLGSFVTDADLGDSPLVAEKELCLHKNGKKCLVCVDRCPVGAVSLDGIDRQRCWDRLRGNHTAIDEFKDLEDTTDVCGKCQVLVPCSLGVPGKKLTP